MRALMVGLLLSAGGAHAAERAYALGGFDRVAVAGSSDVEVRAGLRASVRASGPQVALDRLIVDVANGELRIRPRPGSWRDGMGSDRDTVRFMVTLPVLRGVAVSGSGNVHADRATGSAFAATVSGSGNVEVGAVTAPEVAAKVAGSGSVRLAGQCRRGAFEASGSGNIDAAGLRCDEVAASTSGSGDIGAFAARKAMLSTAGSGDVRVAGRPGTCAVVTAGSGSARCS